MVDWLGVGPPAARGLSRRGSQPVSNRVAEDRRPAPHQTAVALAIINAQYDRVLARAAGGDPAERAVALAEADRLVKSAAALRGRVTDPAFDRIEAPAGSPTLLAENLTIPDRCVR
jgi:hypothetical protein